MSVPGIVQSTLDGDDIASRVSLGSDDELFITPSRTLLYRSEGLLSDESVDEFPHDADRLTVSEGRRKTTFSLEYSLEGSQEFTIPSSKTDDVLHSVLAGVLNGNGITDAGETVVRSYRFSELTLIVTSDRLVKHIGEAVWDEDFEEYHYDDVTGLEFEDGSVATQIVLDVDGRPQRIKAPNEEADDLRERLTRALFEYHDVDSLEALNDALGEDDEPAEPATSTVDFGEGVDPLDANPPDPDDDPAEDVAADDQDVGEDDRTEPTAVASAQSSRPASQTDQSDAESEPSAETADRGATTSASEETIFERDPASSDGVERVDPSTVGAGTGAGVASGSAADPEYDALLERVESLETAVERQTELLEDQQETIEQLIAELRAGR